MPATPLYLKSLKEGDQVRLRDDALVHVKIREWEFHKAEKGKILLIERRRNYTLEVSSEDIDWQVYKNSKARGKRKG